MNQSSCTKKLISQVSVLTTMLLLGVMTYSFGQALNLDQVNTVISVGNCNLSGAKVGYFAIFSILVSTYLVLKNWENARNEKHQLLTVALKNVRNEEMNENH